MAEEGCSVPIFPDNEASLLKANCCTDSLLETPLETPLDHLTPILNPRYDDLKQRKHQLLPLNRRPGPLSAKKKWISAMKRTKPKALVKLRACHVPLDSEKAVCQAFMAQLKRQIQSTTEKKKPPPNPQFILRPPLRMTTE